jgi:hypothetical protein
MYMGGLHRAAPCLARNAKLYRDGEFAISPVGGNSRQKPCRGRRSNEEIPAPHLVATELLTIGENEPYAVSDLTDYTVPVHAERRELPHVEIEIRQDLIADTPGQRQWAERLARLLPAAYARLGRQ